MGSGGGGGADEPAAVVDREEVGGVVAAGEHQGVVEVGEGQVEAGDEVCGGTGDQCGEYFEVGGGGIEGEGGVEGQAGVEGVHFCEGGDLVLLLGVAPAEVCVFAGVHEDPAGGGGQVLLHIGLYYPSNVVYGLWRRRFDCLEELCT